MDYSWNVIHFVADKWLTPSIKAIGHRDQDTISTTYQISGPSQERPTDWAVPLKKLLLSGIIDWIFCILYFWLSWKNDSLALF